MRTESKIAIRKAELNSWKLKKGRGDVKALSEKANVHRSTIIRVFTECKAEPELYELVKDFYKSK